MGQTIRLMHKNVAGWVSTAIGAALLIAVPGSQSRKPKAGVQFFPPGVSFDNFRCCRELADVWILMPLFLWRYCDAPS